MPRGVSLPQSRYMHRPIAPLPGGRVSLMCERGSSGELGSATPRWWKLARDGEWHGSRVDRDPRVPIAERDPSDPSDPRFVWSTSNASTTLEPEGTAARTRESRPVTVRGRVGMAFGTFRVRLHAMSIVVTVALVAGILVGGATAAFAASINSSGPLTRVGDQRHDLNCAVDHAGDVSPRVLR